MRTKAKTDFDGNPIERPEGVTKRYTQATGTPYPALLGGLRNDGTPVITTNMGEQACVYVDNSKGLTYCAVDRSPVTTWFHCLRIMVHKLDRIFSERLVYRVKEALKQSGNTLAGGEQAALPEQTYVTINQQLDHILQEAERSQDGQPDPRVSLEASIAETKKRIVERERIGHEASSVMSGEDLRQHYGALKRLRTALATMQQKLDRLDAEELEQAEAKQKLPEVHERWAAMSLASKQRFIRAATSRIELDQLAAGWAKLTIHWSLLLGGDDEGYIIDEAYIWTTAGKRWTEEEKQLLREHYPSAERDWLMEQLPEREWNAIIAKAGVLRIERPHSVGWACRSTSVVPSPKLSVNDWRIIQEYALDVETVLQKRVYWREYVSLPIEGNNAPTSIALQSR